MRCHDRPLPRCKRKPAQYQSCHLVIDPIGAGFIASLARPGSNLTGLMAYDPSAVGKWLSMLKEIAPQTTRVGLLGNPKTAAYYDYFLGAAQAVAPSLGSKRYPAGSTMMRLI